MYIELLAPETWTSDVLNMRLCLTNEFGIAPQDAKLPSCVNAVFEYMYFWKEKHSVMEIRKVGMCELLLCSHPKCWNIYSVCAVKEK